MASTLRKVECPGYDREYGGHVNCGNTLYEKTYGYRGGVLVPVWKCTNCGTETPRHGRNRRTNRGKARDAYRAIKAEWADTDAALDALVKAGTPSGCLLVYSSTFNHHMDKLLTLDTPSNFDVQYHPAEARKDLQRAKEFVAQKQEAK
jgi:hypothetical protein